MVIPEGLCELILDYLLLSLCFYAEIQPGIQFLNLKASLSVRTADLFIFQFLLELFKELAGCIDWNSCWGFQKTGSYPRFILKGNDFLDIIPTFDYIFKLLEYQYQNGINHILYSFFAFSDLFIISNLLIQAFCFKKLIFSISYTFYIYACFCIFIFRFIFDNSYFRLLCLQCNTVIWSIASVFFTVLRHRASIEQTVRPGKKNIKSRQETFDLSAPYKIESSLDDHLTAPPILRLFLILGQIILIHLALISSEGIPKWSANFSHSKIESQTMNCLRRASYSSHHLYFQSNYSFCIVLMIQWLIFSFWASLSSSLLTFSDYSQTSYFSACFYGSSQYTFLFIDCISYKLTFYLRWLCHLLMRAFWDRKLPVYFIIKFHWVPCFLIALKSLSSSQGLHLVFIIDKFVKYFYYLLQNQILMSVNTFSLNDYQIPEWSAPPHFHCYLEVIKGGTFLDKIPIKSKPFNLIGRLDDLCDIFIDNPTVSRKHAILQYKDGDDYSYLYDLDGTHGTQVNHKKLPPRVYQKVSPFDTIKFGVSSRMYIYRCPQLEQKLEEQQTSKDNKNSDKFLDILAEKEKKLSQTELKEKYLEMLEKDPIYATNTLSQTGKFTGNTRKDNDCDGIDWGITDQLAVYSYRNEGEIQIEADLIRRLPGLDQEQLNKIAQYEVQLRKYNQMEESLNKLSNRGNQGSNSYQDKKQRAQQRFVEALQALQKSEQWIKVHIFGQEAGKKTEKLKKMKQIDSFEDDEFLDRTLVQKRQKKQAEQKKKDNKQIFTTKDYWKLDKQLREALQQLIAIQKIQQANPNQISQEKEEEDQLDCFMKENNDALDQENLQMRNKQKYALINKIEEIKGELTSIIGEAQTQRIQSEERGIKSKKQMSEQKRMKIKEKENKRKLDKVMEELQKIREEEEQEIDEDDIRIFNAYKPQADLEQQLEREKYNEGQGLYKRQRTDNSDLQMRQFEKPAVKYPKWKIERDMEEDDEYVDLTKNLR